MQLQHWLSLLHSRMLCSILYSAGQKSSTLLLYTVESLLPTALVPMERCIEQTIEYTRDRKAFGRSILDNQVVHYRLAELETEVEALRSLAYRTAGK